MGEWCCLWHYHLLNLWKGGANPTSSYGVGWCWPKLNDCNQIHLGPFWSVLILPVCLLPLYILYCICGRRFWWYLALVKVVCCCQTGGTSWSVCVSLRYAVKFMCLAGVLVIFPSNMGMFKSISAQVNLMAGWMLLICSVNSSGVSSHRTTIVWSTYLLVNFNLETMWCHR